MYICYRSMAVKSIDCSTATTVKAKVQVWARVKVWTSQHVISPALTQNTGVSKWRITDQSWTGTEKKGMYFLSWNKPEAASWSLTEYNVVQGNHQVNPQTTLQKWPIIDVLTVSAEPLGRLPHLSAIRLISYNQLFPSASTLSYNELTSHTVQWLIPGPLYKLATCGPEHIEIWGLKKKATYTSFSSHQHNCYMMF